MFLLNNINRPKKQKTHAEQFVAINDQSPAVFDLDYTQLRNKGGDLNKKNMAWSLLEKGNVICVVNYTKMMVEVQIVNEVSNDNVKNASILRADLVGRFSVIKKYSEILRDAEVDHPYIAVHYGFNSGINIVNLDTQLDELEVELIEKSPYVTDMCKRVVTLGALKNIIKHNAISPCINFPEEISQDDSYAEGATVRIFVNAYERSEIARKRCIEHHGTCCQVCKVDLVNIYGSIAAGFIHVHHIKPLSEIKSQYKVDPIRDLLPVCPNCHAMIHRRTPSYSVLEMIEIFKTNQKKI